MTDLGDGWRVGEDFISAVLRVTAQPIWVVDSDGRIRFANPAAIATLGYETADELRGRPSHETIHYRHPDGTPPASECPMHALIESVNTKIRLITRIAFGFRSAQALIALAMLSLGGHKPILPDRSPLPRMSQ